VLEVRFICCDSVRSVLLLFKMLPTVPEGFKMLTSNPDALQALPRVLVKARFRAGEAAASDELCAILDHAETLLADILNPGDQTELFEGSWKILGHGFQDSRAS
jgi:hypothetical protein